MPIRGFIEPPNAEVKRNPLHASIAVAVPGSAVDDPSRLLFRLTSGPTGSDSMNRERVSVPDLRTVSDDRTGFFNLLRRHRREEWQGD